jgi:hypothetical protein
MELLYLKLKDKLIREVIWTYIFIKYVISYCRGLFGGVEVKKDNRYYREERRSLTRGVRVRSSIGVSGKVARVYRSVITDEIKGFMVIWEKEYEGNIYSLFIPITDLGKKIMLEKDK